MFLMHRFGTRLWRSDRGAQDGIKNNLGVKGGNHRCSLEKAAFKPGHEIGKILTDIFGGRAGISFRLGVPPEQKRGGKIVRAWRAELRRTLTEVRAQDRSEGAGK